MRIRPPIFSDWKTFRQETMEWLKWTTLVATCFWAIGTWAPKILGPVAPYILGLLPFAVCGLQFFYLWRLSTPTSEDDPTSKVSDSVEPKTKESNARFSKSDKDRLMVLPFMNVLSLLLIFPCFVLAEIAAFNGHALVAKVHVWTFLLSSGSCIVVLMFYTIVGVVTTGSGK